ncbi:phage tail tape measure protein [Eubacterium ramulus]|uniref:Phage tail tape measure protein n=2 Tax=Eubacterium ramulus TaxID=39490 RepID=A0A844E166_EUBRA|nr:phage tail tape measure protein [Eubacterium ramulus]MSC94511.1 phage tail tape measure protein [Eubacterium ramulus]MSD17397.1 phage tail tape measure protein [Eubacterium ramulus]RYS97507.1 phage tail tape measure protein [Eubacterium ramulus]
MKEVQDMADGSLLFDTKLDETGIESGLSSLKKTIAALGIGKMLKDVSQQVWEVGSSFETSFSKASTLFGDVSVDTDNLKSKIADMSKQTGISAEELNETLYQAMSAGIPVTEDMGTALAAVQTAAKLSVGGFTSSSTAMSGLTTAINAYGLSADDASRIADEFILVQNKGVTTVDELASNMGRAISTGSAYGVNLENLNAAYISLTKGGISTAESTTYLSSMMNELGDSGSDVGKVLQEKTGMSFSQLMDNGYSLADVLDILMASVDGDSSALMNLWGSAEAGKAANAILTQGTDNFRQSLDDLGNSSGTTEDAYSTMMDTADGKMKQVKETANDLFIKVFEKAEPVIAAVLDGFQWLIENAQILVPFLVALGVAFGVMQAQALIAAAAEAEMTVAQYLLNSAFLACPVWWIAMAIAALVAAFIYLWNNCDEFRQFWINLWQNIKDIFFTVWDAVKSFFTEKIPEMFNNLLQWFIALPDNIAYWLGYALGKIIVWCITLPEKAREAGKAFLENVINFFKNLPSNIETWLLNAVAKVSEWNSKLREKGAEAAKGLLTAVVDGLKNLPSKMLEIGGNIVKGLWQGIQNMIGWFKDKIHNFFSGIVDGVKDTLDIHSPSKKFAWIGKMCIEGFEDPFDDYDPYTPFNDAVNANIGTMQANMTGNSGGFDYGCFADATVDAFERAGFTFRANNRELGRFVRGVSMA